MLAKQARPPPDRKQHHRLAMSNKAGFLPRAVEIYLILVIFIDYESYPSQSFLSQFAPAH